MTARAGAAARTYCASKTCTDTRCPTGTRIWTGRGNRGDCRQFDRWYRSPMVAGL